MTSAIAFAIVVAMLWGASDRFVAFLGRTFEAQASFDRQRLLQPSLSIVNLRENLFDLLSVVAPAIAIMVFSIWMVHLAQRQFSVRFSMLKADQARLSPTARFRQIFSWRSFLLQVEKLLKLVLFAVAVALVLFVQREKLFGLMQVEIQVAIWEAWRIAIRTLFAGAGLLIIVAGLDYGLQRWRFELSLRMTDEELREETRAAHHGR